ncbi:MULTISPECIES: YbaL family putative K(+) efflux transporter [Gammaproteobacteria]|jgi:CPA2 family monovalent cation:H+ antiporter-2|uniref:Kef family K(+) transporter n=3 Tax=Gammaproteobacteria TaxID=1236 RepID=A0A498CKG8_9GAMM|nr:MULTISPECIES: YbaL family putative K(+) efflux transporter [Stenotrophomonas]KAB7631361.1 Kef family K(+) transporter [Stenotrophomonas rhizophila]MBW8375764.1 Kef family K(+) transporter [Stenotrophomonas sp.]OWQ53340.1 Kef family K(+) transporter [Stenotrophomonas maltophilia]RLK57030.1 Kef-type potassium/proton antiporter (CPA2 family) [Stenotrophomonas rhizophila]HAU82112.1 Kef family K(+) transporter [Stenotrophomonas sp.]
MHHDTDLINIVAVGLGLAFIFGALANKLRLSPLVGYLIAGICVGPFTPGFVADQALANQLAEIGVMLLMFGVGLHFSLKDLMEVKAIAIPGAIGQILVATLLGWGLAALMGWPVIYGVVFGFSLATASTVVLLRAMEERRLLETTRGKIAIGWLIVEDLACVLALVMMPVLAGVFGPDAANETHTVGSVLASIGWTFVQLGLFVAVMLVVGRRVIPWILERIAGTGSRELFTLAVLAIALGVAFGSAMLFGVSFALGAFFAGMLLNESELSHKAANDSLPLRDAFAVLFFVSVGMLFNPAILIEHPWQVLATAAIIMFGKSAAAFVIVRAFGHPTGTALTISASLAQIGEFAFIIAGLGVTLGILPPTGQALVLAGALISIMLNPLVFGLLDRWLLKHQETAPTTVETELPPGPSLDLHDHAIVIGYGRVGSALAQVLRDRGVPVMIIDDNKEHVAEAHAAGLPGIRGSAASDRVLAEAHPERAKIAVLAIPQPLEAGETLAKLRALNPGLTLLARAHSDAEVKHLLAHGADGTVMAERELAYSLAEMVMSTPPYRTMGQQHSIPVV